MPLNTSKIKTLYEGLKANGSDVGTLQEFTNWFAGNDHYANRKQVFDAYHAAGADVGKDYNEFMQLMYEKPKATKKQKSATNSVQPNYGGKPADFFSVTGAERPTADNFRATAKAPFRKQLGYYKNAVATRKVAAAPQYINGVETKGFERVPIKAVGVEDYEPLFTEPHELSNTYQKALPEWDEMYPSDQTLEARAKSRKLARKIGSSAKKSYDLMLSSGAWDDYDDIPSPSDWGEYLRSDNPDAINDRNALIANKRAQGRDDIADAIESAVGDLKERERVGSSHAGYDNTINRDREQLRRNFATLDDNNDVTSYRKAAMIHNDVTSKLDDIDEYKTQLEEESKRDRENGDADGMLVTSNNQTQFLALASAAEKQRNKERGYIHTAVTALEDSKRLIEEASHHGQTNFFSGAWRGLKDGVIDARTWDIGLNDLCNAKNVYEVLLKADSGKTLTKGEQMLLDAKATEAAANLYYQGYIGRGYQAGQSTANSLPLIAEIVINPASTAGKSASSMMARYMIKRFGTKVAKGTFKMGERALKNLGTSSAGELVMTVAKGATKAERRAAMQTLLARGGARIAGDAVGGYVMAATTGQMRTLADATNRLTGSANFKIKTDKNGNERIAYDGHEEPEETSFLTAYGKALTANAIEYGSEFQGEYFPFIGEIFGKIGGKIGGRLMRTTAGKGVNKMLTATEKLAMKVPMAQATKDFIVHATHNELVNTLNGIRKRAHISGVGGEYMEEVLGNIENAILVGDNDFSTEEGKGVFNLSDNLNTFLSCALMTGALSATGAAGYRTPKYRARKAVESAYKSAERSMGTHLWRGFTTQYDNAAEESDKVKAVTDILTNPNLNNKQRRMVVDYVKARQFQEGVADGSYSEEPTQEEEQIRPYQGIYEAGQEMPTSQRAYAQAEYDYTRQRAQQLCPDIDNYETAEFYAETHPDATAEQKQAARDYLMNKARMDGINDAMQTDYDNATAKNKSFVDNVTNKADGTVTRISLNQQKGDFYVRNGNIVLRADGKLDTQATGARNATIIVTDAQGNEQSVPIRDIVGTPQVQTAEDTLNGLNAKPEAERKAAQDTLNGKLQFTEGKRFTINDNEGNPQSVTIQRDQQTGALAAVIGEDTANPIPLTENAIADLQQRANDYRAKRVAEAYERRNNEQETEDNTEEATRGSSTDTDNTAPQSADTESAPLNIGDEIKFSDEQGNEQSGTINDYNEAEGKYEVEFPTPPDGKSTVDWYTPEELRALTATEDSAQTTTATPQSGENTTESATTAPQSQGRAIDRIPTDENGQHIYEKAPVRDTASALMEANNNDAEEAISTARLMAAKAAERAERAKQLKDDGETVDEIQKNKAAYKTAQENAAYWDNVAQTLEMLQKADDVAAEEKNETNGNVSNGTEQTQETEAEPKPIGKGFFGNIYDQFRGQAKAAFDFLMNHKSGDLLGVFHRNDLGDIDLVWGDRTKNQGLDHIIDKHIERHNDFANAEEAMTAIEDVINNGTVNEEKSRWDKVVLEKDGLRVVVSKNVRDNNGQIINENKNWVVTAFDGNVKQKDKATSDTTLVSPSTNEGGRAVTPGEDLSADKGTESSQPSQKPSEKIAEAEAQTETNPTETESQDNASHQQLRETHAYPEQPLAERTRKACEAVAKALGMELEWVDHMKANGEFVAKGKDGKPTIRIARDAENPLSTVFSHEGTHAVRSLSKEAYQSLVNKAREVVGEKEWNRRLDKAKKLYNEETEEEKEAKKKQLTEEEKEKETKKKPQTEDEKKKEAKKKQLTDDELVEEVVADIVGEMVTNRDMAEQLSYRLDHPTLSALRDVARKLWDAVKRYVGGIKLTDKEQAAKDFADTIERAFADAKNKAKGAQNVEEGKRYSLRQRNRDASQMDMRASRMYEDAMASTWNRIDEAWHDDLLSVRKLQEALEQTTGQRVRDFENVYLHAVHRSSRNKVMMDRLMFDLINPMLDKVKELCTKHNLTQDEIEIYLNCKHGLERNQLLAQRKADEQMTNDKKRFAQLVAKYFAEETYNTSKPSVFQEEARKVAEQCAANGLNLAATRTEAANAADAYVQSQAADYLAHARERDYSGLTGIFDADGTKRYKVKDLEDLARMEIDRFENEVGQTDTAELWNRIHALNNYSLHQSYRSGLISKRQYDDTRKMYQWYVPLRGFNETTADDVYDYLSHGEPKTQSAIREAKGRTSRAADILATMMNMGNSAVIQGNKNQVKQKLLNLALNYDNPLLSVSKAYYVENPATGNWELAQRKQGETWDDYTQRMEAEVQNGTAVTMSDKLGIPLRTMKWQGDEHAVHVKRGGEEYIVYINGNPRAAQALNGLLRGEPKNPGRVEKFLQGTMGWLSKSVTSLNPEFVISNFERDLSSAVTVSRGKYGADYAGKFMRNALSLTPGLSAMAKHGEGAVGIYRLFNKFENGTLDRTNPIEAYFEEFMMNGGETGFTRTLSVDDYQAQIERRLAETRTLPMRAADALGTLNGWVDTANRGVENICRFAAFVTSRQAGKSVLTATQDAKEVSTNFNLHGSGDFGNALVRKIAIFVNPAIQSVWQYAELTHEHPQRMLRMMAGTAMLGAAMTIASAMLVGGGDGDDDDSDIWHITPFTRRNYLIIPTGLDGTYVKYNLAPELRAIYGVGVIAAETLMGRMRHESVVGALGNQLAQLVPMSFFSPQEIFDRNGTPVWKTAARAFTPAYVNPFAEAYLWNEDFMGKPISKDSEAYGNASKPQYLLASDDTWHPLVEMSRLLNNISGGMDYKKGWVDINPSKLSHLTKSYTGGIYQFLAKAVKASSWLADGMPDGEIDAKDIPIVSRFATSTRSDYNRYLPSNTDYKYYKNEYDATRAAVKAFENGNGNRKDYEQLRKTDEYKRYLIMHDSDLLTELKTLSTELKEATDDDEQKRVQKHIYETRKRLVDAVNRAEEQGELDEYASSDLVNDIERETDIDRKLQKQVRLNLRRAKIRKDIGLMTSEQYERLRKAYAEIE